MDILFSAALVATGCAVGTLAGILGLGGGVFLVPALVAFGVAPLNAVATSSVPVLIASISAVTVHLRSGQLKVVRALRIGVVAALAAQLGVVLAHHVNSRFLLALFAAFLCVNIILMKLRKSAAHSGQQEAHNSAAFTELVIGAIGGLFSGFFGVGGGVVMVPLLVLWAREPLKEAVKTSLAVVLVSAVSSATGHAFKGSVLWSVGLLLSVGSLVGAQIGVRLLPRFSEKAVSRLFISMLAFLVCYVALKAWFME